MALTSELARITCYGTTSIFFCVFIVKMSYLATWKTSVGFIRGSIREVIRCSDLHNFFRLKVRWTYLQGRRHEYEHYSSSCHSVPYCRATVESYNAERQTAEPRRVMTARNSQRIKARNAILLIFRSMELDEALPWPWSLFCFLLYVELSGQIENPSPPKEGDYLWDCVLDSFVKIHQKTLNSFSVSYTVISLCSNGF